MPFQSKIEGKRYIPLFFVVIFISVMIKKIKLISETSINYIF